MCRLRAAALLALAASNVACASEPLQKVITMLEDLKEKVTSEGTDEAKTYDKFACFCKDTTKEKLDAIEAGKGDKDTLMATISDATAKREKADSDIADKVKELQKNSEDLQKVKSERKEAKATYAANEMDLAGAIEALEAAIRVLKTSKMEAKTDLVQLGPIVKTVRIALEFADALGLASAHPKARRSVTALLEGGSEDPELYSFHADDIIKMLEDLHKDFEAKREAVDKEEVEAEKTHAETVESMHEIAANGAKAIEDSKKEKGKLTEDISTANQDLTAVSATLLDDQMYLTDLSKKCNEKAVLWDQRTKGRADEISALSSALDILSGIVKEEEGAALVQRRPATTLLATRIVTQESYQEAEPVDFLQIAPAHSPRRLLGALARRGTVRATNGRSAVEELLRSRATSLKSALLLRLANEVRDDPFTKVKKMIQELIERLLKEAASEADHKAWCDKGISKAEQARGYKVEEVEALNAALEAAEVRFDKLTEQSTNVKAELEELQKSMEKQKSLREEESAGNEKALKEAKEGKDAVDQALDILQKYYKTAAKAASLVQDEPDAGFDSAYTGDQGGAYGVIGMLEVVRQDFEDEVANIEKNEKAAKQEFLEFETTTKSSLATKGEAEKMYDTGLKEVEAQIAEDKEKLTGATEAMAKLIEELLALHKACFYSPESKEEERIKRKEEIASLQEALCILEGNAGDASGIC